MSTIQNFEDLKVWKFAREICSDIYKLCQEPGLSKDFALRDQMRRASGSVMDNIAEGFERNGNKEFLHFLYIAKGSSGELRSQLYRALDQHYITPELFEEIKKKTLLESSLLGRFIHYVKNSDLKGPKYDLVKESGE